MKTKFILLAIFSISIFTSCFDDDDGFCIRGEGDFVTEQLDLADIHSIDLDLAANVVITESDEQNISITAQQNIIDLIKDHSTVSQGLWRIKVDNKCIFADDIRIFIDMKSLKMLEIDGSGNISSDGIFEAVDDLDLDIDGSGKIDLDLSNVSNLIAIIDGSGDINLGAGNVQKLKIDIDGSGDLKAFSLEAKSCEVDIDGSGDVEVNVTDDLLVDIDGSGDVCYRGNPDLSFTIDGSGSVSDCD